MAARVITGAGALFLLIIYNLSLCSANFQETFTSELINQPSQNEGPTIEQVLDAGEVPNNETIQQIEIHQMPANVITGYHIYYNSSIYKDKSECENAWESVKNAASNSMLSQFDRRVMVFELNFDFPFYGHPVRNVTVVTSGFLYTGNYVHSWHGATQYIAPLMALFDTSLSNDSFVRIQDNGTAFTVVWEKVLLQAKPDVGSFTFSVTLHKNGDIVFIYYNIPIEINEIKDYKHPVKVGLSDAYIIEKNVRRKTITEYHRINFSNINISNYTIIYLKPLPTCLDNKDYLSCSNQSAAFNAND